MRREPKFSNYPGKNVNSDKSPLTLDSKVDTRYTGALGITIEVIKRLNLKSLGLQ